MNQDLLIEQIDEDFTDFKIEIPANDQNDLIEKFINSDRFLSHFDEGTSVDEAISFWKFNSKHLNVAHE